MTAFDVAVIGAGPGGLAAAVAASRAGASVALIGDGVAPGGQIWRREFDGTYDRRGQSLMDAARAPSITTLNSATVVDAEKASEGFELLLERDGRRETIRAARVVLATGARELFLPFPGWTLPGVFGVGGIQAMTKGGFDVRGKRVVIAGTGPLLLAVAASLTKRGATIVAVVEQASRLAMAKFAMRLAARPTIAREAAGLGVAVGMGKMQFGKWVSAAHGDSSVRSARITDGHTGNTVECDMLCVGYGLVPNTELGELLGCEIVAGSIAVDLTGQTTVPGVFAAGECTGIGGVHSAVRDGTIAGRTVSGAASLPGRRRAPIPWSAALARTFQLRKEILALADEHTIVCRCEDVRLGQIDDAWTSRQAKLYTRIGMGPCQGRVCGSAMRLLRGWTPDRVRAPLYPSLVSTLMTHDVIVTPE